MKKTYFLWLIASLLMLAVPTVQTSAFDDEVEIELFELTGFLPGDGPLDQPSIGDDVPPRPTSFHATIAGRTLSVMTDVTSSTRVIVRNSTGTQVVNQTFVGGTTAQLETDSYSIEIQSGSLTLVGQFSAH